MTSSSSATTTTVGAAQLSHDKFLYVWTANHVGRLTRRNKLSSPPLELPEESVAIGLGYKEIVDSLKIVLLRGVVRSATDVEADDPIGVFLQCQFKQSSTDEAKKNVQHVRCKLSVSCTPVRPGGHSHSGGPDDIELTVDDNFKGMRSLLPAVAIKTRREDADANEDERRFAESTPVEVHMTIQFLPPKAAAAAAQSSSSSSSSSSASAGNVVVTTNTTGELVGQAASLIGDVASSASAVFGSWWSSASAAVANSTVLPTVKAALSTAATRAENLAQKIIDRKESSSSSLSDVTGNNNDAAERDNRRSDATSSAAAAAAAAGGASPSPSSHASKAPWDDVPASYRSHHPQQSSGSGGGPQSDDAAAAVQLTPQRWRQLLLKTMCEDESAFLWAPDSAYGVHRQTAAGATCSGLTDSTDNVSPAARLSQLRPQYPEFAFEPDEELLLSRIGLSANLLRHCNDGYNFDNDVEPHFVDASKPETLLLRQMRLRLVPRVCSEERFWGAFLWRVACLALSTNVEQESVVKTLLRKPAVAVIKAPIVAAGAGPVGDEHESQHHHHHHHSNDGGGGNNNSSNNNNNDGGSSSRSGGDNGSRAGSNSMDDHQRLMSLPDAEALMADAEEAQGLFSEVVDDMLTESETGAGGDDAASPASAAALFTASQHGVARCLRNTEDAIAALQRVLDDERVDAAWKVARSQQLAKLVAQRETLAAALTRGESVLVEVRQRRKQQQQQQQQQQEQKQQEQRKEAVPEAPAPAVAAIVSKPLVVADVSSPDPKEPQPQPQQQLQSASLVAAEDSKSPVSNKSDDGGSPTAAAASSKPRAPVLMPWEEDE